MVQLILTPAAGKRLIAKAVAAYAPIQAALKTGTVVIVAGTTNGYVAEEILGAIGQLEGFSRGAFSRGITLPPSGTPGTGGSSGRKAFQGDVVIVKGEWQKGKTIFDVAGSLKEGDIILKGANALNVSQRRAAVLIGHPEGGTIAAAMQAVIGKRVKLVIPVGLEKRVSCDLDSLSLEINSPGVKGPRLLPVQGEVITELDSVSILSGATAELFAAGGVCGAEGTVWLAVKGKKDMEEHIKKIADGLSKEPPFAF